MSITSSANIFSHSGLWVSFCLWFMLCVCVCVCMVLNYVLISLFYMKVCSYPTTIYWRDWLFSIVWSCLLCHKLIDHRYVSLFWAFYPVPLVYIFVFVLVLYCFDNCSFVVLSEVREPYSSSSVFPKIALAIWGLLCLYAT